MGQGNLLDSIAGSFDLFSHALLLAPGLVGLSK
jgi:hypothetical protein